MKIQKRARITEIRLGRKTVVRAGPSSSSNPSAVSIENTIYSMQHYGIKKKVET